MPINVFGLPMIPYHIIVFTVPGIIRYPYQQIDITSTSMLVTICIGGVAKGVKGVLESFIQIHCDIMYGCISDIAVS